MTHITYDCDLYGQSGERDDGNVRYRPAAISNTARCSRRVAKSYPVLLRSAGYRTAFAGKFGFEVSKQPAGNGKWLPEKDFDRWGGGPGQTSFVTAKNASMKAYAKKWPHATLSYGAFAQDFIRDSAKDAKQGKAPFCLSISFKAPHRPVDPDPKFDHVYAGKKFPKPANYGRAAGKHFSKQSTMGRQYERFGSWNYDKDYDGVMAKYHQQIYAIDVAVGMIRDALNEQAWRTTPDYLHFGQWLPLRLARLWLRFCLTRKPRECRC